MTPETRQYLLRHIKFGVILFLLPAMLVVGSAWRRLAEQPGTILLLFLAAMLLGVVVGGLSGWLRSRLAGIPSTSGRIRLAAPVIAGAVATPFLLVIQVTGWQLTLTVALSVAYWVAVVIWLRARYSGFLHRLSVGVPLALVPFALITLALLLFNLPVFDEELDPEIAALIKTSFNVADMPDNGYPYGVGLLAPADQDPAAWGRRIIQAYQQQDTALVQGHSSQLPAGLHRDELVLPTLTGCEDWATCKATARTRPEVVRDWLEKNTLAQARCDTLVGFRSWRELYVPQTQSSEVVPVPLRICRQLHMAGTALALAGPGADAALEKLLGDLILVRNILAHSQTLIGKLIGNASAGYTTLQIADLLQAQPALAIRFETRLKAALLPLSESELSLESALKHEHNLLAFEIFHPEISLQTQIPSGLWLGQRLWQRNASINELYRYGWKLTFRFDQQGWQGNDPEYRRLQAAAEARSDAPLFRYYNFGGSLLARIVTPNTHGYTYQMHDLDGLIRLVALQAHILAFSATSSVEGLLAADKAYYDPYRQRPMAYDAPRRQIWFAPWEDNRNWAEAATRGNEGRIVVGVGPAAGQDVSQGVGR